MTTHVFFEVDLSEHLDADGRLTAEGTALLTSRLREQFRSRFPFAPADVIDRTVGEITADVAGQRPADIKIRVTAGTARAQADRACRGVGGVQRLIVELAQLIDTDKSVSGPHVFLCGEVSAKVETAARLLREATVMIDAMLNCKDCFGGDSEAQHEPTN